MKKNNKTAMVMSIAVLTLVLMGTACSNNNNSDSSPSASASATVSPSGGIAPETGNPSPTSAAETQNATGDYVGLQDTHTLEIKTGNGPTAFQISPEIASKVDPWEEGTKVKFQFIEETMNVDGKDVKISTIVSIDKQ
jgi:ABC-type oligopeptide transport system substrate-binding subunit